MGRFYLGEKKQKQLRYQILHLLVRSLALCQVMDVWKWVVSWLEKTWIGVEWIDVGLGWLVLERSPEKLMI